MILIGQYDSPFVRRVAVTLQHYDMPCKRRVISVDGDFERMLAVNPLGKVPALYQVSITSTKRRAPNGH